MVHVLLTMSCQFVPTRNQKYTHILMKDLFQIAFKHNWLVSVCRCVGVADGRGRGSSVWRWWCTGNQVITGGQRAPPTACCQLCRGLQWVSFWYETKTRNIRCSSTRYICFFRTWDHLESNSWPLEPWTPLEANLSHQWILLMACRQFWFATEFLFVRGPIIQLVLVTSKIAHHFFWNHMVSRI